MRDIQNRSDIKKDEQTGAVVATEDAFRSFKERKVKERQLNRMDAKQREMESQLNSLDERMARIEQMLEKISDGTQ